MTKELNDRGSEADEQSLLKGSVLSEREKKEDSPDAAPDKARIEPRRCESRSKFDSQRGRNPGFSKEPEHGAVHKAAKNSGAKTRESLRIKLFIKATSFTGDGQSIPHNQTSLNPTSLPLVLCPSRDVTILSFRAKREFLLIR